MKVLEFQAGALTWEVHVIPLDLLEGETDFDERRVYLDADLPPDARWSTFMHELLHVCEFTTKTEIGDKSICRLEHPLAQALQFLRPHLDNLVLEAQRSLPAVRTE